MRYPVRLLLLAVGCVLAVFVAAIAGRPSPVQAPTCEQELHGADLVGPRGLYVIQVPREPPAVVLRALEDQIERIGAQPPAEYLGSTYRDRRYIYTFRVVVGSRQGPTSRYVSLVYDPYQRDVVGGE